MTCLAHSGGHNSIVPGAFGSGYAEHVEVRNFLASVDKYVRSMGWETVNCTDEVGRTKTQVWTNSGNKHLKVKHSKWDLQYHLNATTGATGVEVLYHPKYGSRERAAELSDAIAKVLGIKDRGPKERTDLGWLNMTKTGLMVEICFIDNKSDMEKLKGNWDAVARSVATVITGKVVQTVSEHQILKTGGFRNEEEAAKLIAYLLAKKLYTRMQTIDGDLSLETGGLSSKAKAEIESFFKSNGWWYEIKEG
jgi:N-acetylmuramoyl-L-alanine amidase